LPNSQGFQCAPYNISLCSSSNTHPYPLNEITPCFLTTTISVFLMMSSNSSPPPFHPWSPVGDDLANQFLQVRLAELMAESSPTPTPSVVPPPAPSGWQTVTFSSQPLEFSNPATGFQGGSLSQAPSSPRVSLGNATPHTMNPCNVPLGVKPVGNWSLSGNVELSVFNILNIFCWRWFLSTNQLKA
jgi:hypothetical protein